MINVFYKILKKANHLFHPIIGEIWCLHRVVASRSLFKSNRDLEITPSYLESLIIDYRSKGYNFVDIDSIFQNLSKYNNKKSINISFDDGFKDIYQFAYPIFKKHNVPFTIYLTTDFPNKKIFLWWMILEEIVLKNDRLTLSDGTVYLCTTDKEKQTTFETILSSIYSSNINMPTYFKQVFDNYLDNFSDYNKHLTLNWTELNEMLDSGLCTLGSHSVSHYALTKLNREQIKFELYNSKKIIEEETGRLVQHFSYPHSFCNDEVVALVKQSEYKTAVLGYGGKIRYRDDKFLLKRVCITE